MSMSRKELISRVQIRVREARNHLVKETEDYLGQILDFLHEEEIRIDKEGLVPNGSVVKVLVEDVKPSAEKVIEAVRSQFETKGGPERE